MIIGLAGQKNTGKDTVAAYLIKQHQFERRAFADSLKRSVAALFNIPFSDVDRLKNDPDVEIGITRNETAKDRRPSRVISFREFLQRYGTESHRDVFGENFWLDQSLPVQGFYVGRRIVITDVRFRNEAERIKFLGGTVIKVQRPVPGDPPVKDPHSGEAIDFQADYQLVNDGTIDELYQKIELLLDEVLAA